MNDWTLVTACVSDPMTTVTAIINPPRIRRRNRFESLQVNMAGPPLSVGTKLRRCFESINSNNRIYLFSNAEQSDPRAATMAGCFCGRVALRYAAAHHA
jgi:hypothetical protein